MNESELKSSEALVQENKTLSSSFDDELVSSSDYYHQRKINLDYFDSQKTHILFATREDEKTYQ